MAEWVGLNNLLDNPDLTFVSFIAFFIIAALGVRFGAYAYWNGKATKMDAQIPLWGYLMLIGLCSALFGLFGILAISLLVGQDALLSLADGMMLGLVLCLALAMRSVYANAAFDSQRNVSANVGGGRPVVVAFGVLVLVSTGGLVIFPPTATATADLLIPERIVALVHGLAGVVFLAYGYLFGRGQLSKIQVQGTLLDTLLRHILPVLLFASLVPILELAWVVGLDLTIVMYVQVIFVVMTATTLMTATIKLRQNLSGIRG
jgi:hypothetical protein